ncbi:nuclear transport factor 2 family protein [Thalassotalea ganghwensis]
MSKNTTQQIEKEVMHAFNGLVEASSALDMQRYFDYFDQEKFVGLSANGINWNSIDDLKALIEPSFAMVDKIESLTFTNVQISVIDSNTVILVNEYEQSVVLASGDKVKGAGGGTQVWSKASGSWKLVSVSASNKST